MRCEAPTTAMLAGFIRGARSMDDTAARISLSVARVSTRRAARGPAASLVNAPRRGDIARRALRLGLFQAGVQGVAETVAEEVEAEDGHEDGNAGKERDPGVGLDERDVGFQVPAPARRRRLRAEAEEGERGLHDDRGGDAGRAR